MFKNITIRILQITIIFITIFAINSVLSMVKADIHKKEGKESLKKNFPYLAVDKFSNALKLNNSDGEARGYLGISYSSLAEKNNKGELLKKAIYEMKDARKTYEDSLINYHLAKAYELSGDIDNAIQEAVKSYNQIPSEQTKDKLIILYKMKGDMLLSQNKRDDAIKFYTKFIELKGTNVTNKDIAGYEFLRNLMPDNFFILYCLAKLYMEQHLFEKAVIELEHIKKIGIFNDEIKRKLIDIYYNLGIKYFSEKKFKETEKYLIYVLNLDSVNRFGNTIDTVYKLSMTYEQIGDIHKAEETLLKLENIDTHKGQGYYQVGQLYMGKLNPQKAIEYLEKYLPFRPASDIGIFTNLGNLYEQVGNINKAVEILLKLEEIDTQKGQGYYQIGQLLSRKANPQKAIEYFEKYLPFRPISNVSVFIYLGELYEQVGDVDKAVKIYSKFEDINSYKGQGHYYIGLLYEKKGKWINAIREFENVLKIRSQDIQLLLKIGQLYERIGDDRKAIEIYKKVITIDPTKVATLSLPMVRLYEKVGEKEKASLLFKNIRYGKTGEIVSL